jgi:hypothetical protein
MLTITDAAGEYLTALLDSAHSSNKTAIRFVLEGNSLSSTYGPYPPWRDHV